MTTSTKMKIPEIKYPKKNGEDYIIFLPREAEVILQSECIWCYSKKQVEDIVDYFLKTGKIKVKYVDIWGSVDPFTPLPLGVTRESSRTIVKEFDMGNKENPERKLWIIKKVGRVRKRPKEIGGNIKEGELWKKD